MKIGIIGSGSVAQLLGRKLAEGGHAVTVSSRDTAKAKQSSLGPLPSPDDWASEVRAQGLEAAAGSFAEAAAAGELIINATPGGGSLEAPRRREPRICAARSSSTSRTLSTSRRACRRS